MSTKKKRAAAPRVRKLAKAINENLQPEVKAISEKSRRLPLSKLHISKLPGIKQIIWFLKLLVPKYFVNAWREVRQVTWPSGRETRRLTLAVFIFATVFGLAVAIVDKGLDEFFKKVVLK